MFCESLKFVSLDRDRHVNMWLQQHYVESIPPHVSTHVTADSIPALAWIFLCPSAYISLPRPCVPPPSSPSRCQPDVTTSPRNQMWCSGRTLETGGIGLITSLKLYAQWNGVRLIPGFDCLRPELSRYTHLITVQRCLD